MTRSFEGAKCTVTECLELVDRRMWYFDALFRYVDEAVDKMRSRNAVALDLFQGDVTDLAHRRTVRAMTGKSVLSSKDVLLLRLVLLKRRNRLLSWSEHLSDSLHVNASSN